MKIEKANTLKIMIINLVFLIIFTPLKFTMIDDLANTVIVKNLTKSKVTFSKNFYSFFERISDDPKSNLINSFYALHVFQTTNEKGIYIDLNSILRIDWIQENDIKDLNSIFIKENLTEPFENPECLIYNGKSFLILNKYNFISLFTSYYWNRDNEVKFYALNNTEGKNKIDIVHTTKSGMFGTSFNLLQCKELVYYTLSNSSIFTSEELQNEGRILLPGSMYFTNGKGAEGIFLVFIEVSIKTMRPIRIIFAYKNGNNPYSYPGYSNSERYSYSYLKVFRNRFAFFGSFAFDLKNLMKIDHFWIYDNLNNIFDGKKYSFIVNPCIYDKDYFILQTNGTQLYGLYTEYYTLLELSKKNIIKSSEKEKENIEEVYLKYNLDLFFFGCSLIEYFEKNHTNYIYYCQLLKLNVKGDSLNNTNTNLYIKENDSLLYIAPYNKKNNVLNHKYSLLTNYQKKIIEITEINRKLDEKKKL